MTRPTQRVNNLAMPANGARIVPVDLDFTAATGSNGAAINFDLVQELEKAELDFIQSVFIDNRVNAQPFILTLQGVGGFGYTIGVAPNSQGVFPLPVEGMAKFAALTVGLFVVPLIFWNIALPYAVWKCQ
jgi:hypothetical protein